MLARTDPRPPPSIWEISYLLLDMRTKGVRCGH